MSTFRQVCRSADVISWLFHNVAQTKMLKVDRSSLDIAVLEKRLAEAERRISLLFNEITDIKSKLSLAKRLNDSTPTTSIIDSGPSTSGIKRHNSNCTIPASPSKRTRQDFQIENGYVTVYVDGACENNGRQNAKAGIGVWFGEDHPLNISEPVVGRPTNNTAEIQACIAAAKTVKENGYNKIKFVTDSEFVINCMTQWIKKWKINNWKVTSGGDVKNKEDLVKLDNLLHSLQDVKWEHVRGHTGVRGNEEADRLARAGALRYVKS